MEPLPWYYAKPTKREVYELEKSYQDAMDTRLGSL